MVRLWLDLMIFKVFSNLSDSMILSGDYVILYINKKEDKQVSTFRSTDYFRVLFFTRAGSSEV